MTGIRTSGRNIPIQIMDLLTTHDGTWYTISNVADWLGKSKRAVQRAVWRLVDEDQVETRYMPGPRNTTVIEIRVPDRAAIDALLGT